VGASLKSYLYALEGPTARVSIIVFVLILIFLLTEPVREHMYRKLEEMRV
jgi:hypothetical protein